MVSSSFASLRPSPWRLQGYDAALVFFIFAGGGFVVAVATYVMSWEATLFWDPPTGMPALVVIFEGMPLIGLIATVYGFGFVWTYLSFTLGIAATVAALAVWRYERISVRCLMGLLAVCPLIVFAQVRVFGAPYDPTPETEADLLTPTGSLIRFSPLLLPALVSAWFVVRRWQSRGRDRGVPTAPAP